MRTFKIISAFLLLLFSLQAFAQPQFLSAANYLDYGPGSVERDHNGNIFRRTGQIVNNLMQESLTKYSPAGVLIWQKTFYNNQANAGSQIVEINFDSNNNVLLTLGGRYRVDFDAGPGTLEFTSSAYIAIIKLDNDGNLLWGKCINSNSGITRTLTRIDDGDNIYLGLEARRKIDYDMGPDSAFVGIDTPYGFMVMAKYDSMGNYIFAAGMGSGNTGQETLSEYIIHDGNIYIAGAYNNNVDFDLKQGVNMPPAQGTNFFVAKYDLDYNLIWVKYSTGAGLEAFCDIVITDNIIYTLGRFDGTVDFDINTNNTSTLTALGNLPNIFLAKYDTSFNLIWKKQLTGRNDLSIGTSITLDSSENVLFGGTYNDSLFITGFPQNKLYPTSPSEEAFITGFTKNGDLIWFLDLGDIGDDEVENIYVDDYTNQLHLMGDFGFTVDFDFGPGQSNLNAGNTTQKFVAFYNIPLFGADIKTFYIPEQVGPTIIDTATQTITMSVATTANLSALTPLFTVSELAIPDHASGVTQNFSAPFTYVVTSYDSLITKNWVVNVTHQPAYEAEILTLTIPGQIQSIVNPATQSVVVIMPAGTNVTALTPTIGISPQATINPPGGTPQDFTWLMDYTVTSFDGLVVKDWGVAVTVLDDIKEGPIKQIALYPNPTNGLLTISTGNLNDVGFQLCDITGRVLFTQQLTNATMQVDVSHFAHGLYFCRFISNGNIIGTKKVVVN
jgi:hypothetical protein